MVSTSHSFIILLLLAALAVCSPTNEGSNHKVSSKRNSVSWDPCSDQSVLQCATFETPLDYSNSSVGNAQLRMIRYKATSKNRLGSLFVNPGGPGHSGVAYVEAFGQSISELMRGRYDIVSWDPRGINNTIPRIDCFNSREVGREWVRKLDAIDVKTGRTFTAANADALYALEGIIDQTLSDYFNACSTAEGDMLKYVGTAATVRDLVAMADALEGANTPINYWGLSYGTVIGSYLVNMFPSRVGRVVLDGTISPNTWSAQASYLRPRNYLVDSERAFEGFCKACAEARSNCVLAQGQTPEQLKEQILSLIDDVDRLYPLGFYYSTAEFRFDLFSDLYWPQAWNELAQWLKDLRTESTEFSATGHNPEIHQDGSRRLKPRRLHMIPDFGRVDTLSRPASWKARDNSVDESDDMNENAYHAITCGDVIDIGNVTTRTVLDEIVFLSQNVSSVFGPGLSTEAGNYCHRWHTRAVERFTGPWDAVPANPVLVIGNTADPITPLINSKWVVDQLGFHAALVTQKAYGHTSTSMPSACTQNVIELYLLTGQLPPSNTTCDTDTTLFAYSDGEAYVPESVWQPSRVAITPLGGPESSLRSSAQQFTPRITKTLPVLALSGMTTMLMFAA